MTADGHVKKGSRTENEELFPLVIGGYGLFGVILDVTIQLTDDILYVSEIKKIDYKKYPDYFAENILSDDATGLHYARLSITPNSLFDEMYMTTFKTLDDGNDLFHKNED